MSSISVVIPAYNCSFYLLDAVESICNQTVRPQEIIIVDDGSSDETSKVANTCAERHPSLIRYLYQNNQGPSSARNTGIRNARGEFIAFLDADDLWLPSKLELQLKHLQAQPLCGIVGCGYFLVDPNLGIIEERQGLRVIDHRSLMRQLAIKNVISGSASGVLVRKVCFDQVGFFDESLRTSEDWDMWFRIGNLWQIDILSEPLAKIRICAGSNSAPENINRLRLDSIRVLNRIYSTDPWKSDKKLQSIAYSDRYFSHATDYMNLGKRFMALNLMAGSFFYNSPYFVRTYRRIIPMLIRICIGDRAYLFFKNLFGRTVGSNSY